MQRQRPSESPSAGFVREAVTDLARELRTGPARAVEALSDVVLLAGGLYLLSSIGEESGRAYDVTARTTLAAVGVGLLAGAVLLGALALVLDAGARRRAPGGAGRGALRSRRRVCAAMAVGALLALVGTVALVGS